MARSIRIARPRTSRGRSVSTLLIKRSTSDHGGPIGSDSSEYTRGPSIASARSTRHQPRPPAKRTNDLKAFTTLLMERRQQPPRPDVQCIDRSRRPQGLASNGPWKYTRQGNVWHIDPSTRWLNRTTRAPNSSRQVRLTLLIPWIRIGRNLPPT